MLKYFHYYSKIAALVAALALLQTTSLAQQQYPPGSKQEISLKSFLQNFVGDAPEAKTTEYSYALVDLKDDGRHDVVVYLTSDGWCGSGGCTTLVLAPYDVTYKIITKIIITRPPIRILNTKTNGWHDIAVQVQGGGIIRAYEAKLSFDGRTYPSNPSALPARHLEKNAPGKVIVPVTALTEGGAPLY
jgi:hypothetical protein